jgi:hypothetical protein
MKTKLFLLLTPILLSCFALLPIAQAAPSPSNVIVVNTTASPMPLRDVDNPARQPFQAEAVGGFADGASTTGDITLTTVPVGKRLVIEHVSVLGKMLAPQRLVLGGIGSGQPGGKVHWLEIKVQGSNADGTLDYFVASQLVRFYQDPGPVRCLAERDSTAGANPASVTFTISGYFVDCPTCVP